MDSAGCLACATRGACILAAAGPSTLDTLQPAIGSQRLHQGDTLEAQGRLSRMVAIVKIGTVFMLHKGIDGVRRPIGLAGRGTAFGLFRYFDRPNLLSALAATPVRVCEIRHDDLRLCAAADPALARELTVRAAARVGAIASWSEGMRLRGVVNQLAHTLVLLSRAQGSALVRLPNHSSIAELLGTSRESITRAFATLKAEGGVALLERRQCEIRSEALLRRLAGANAP